MASVVIGEDLLIRQVLQEDESPPPSVFRDDLYSRLAYVCSDPSASDLDIAVLIRHLLRRWSLRDGRSSTVAVSPRITARLRRVSERTRLRQNLTDTWSALPWHPNWLGSQGIPDAAAAAGTSKGERFKASALTADPFFEACTGYATYRTPGQRAACRAVVSASEGSTLIAMLPTGSGKTEVALCLTDQRRHAVTLIVVPTVALAYDFERRFRDHFMRRHPNADPAALSFAWTATTPEDQRERMRRYVLQGRQRVLVTSPESMTRTLRLLLLEAAGIGRIGGFVIDEAHLVTQWGRDFRPEFRTLADLRRDILNKTAEAGRPRPMTLLLSATLGAAELADLHDLFAEPGPCTLIAANALRAEPELWTAVTENAAQRDSRVLEALEHLPRPAILYVTAPEDAERWQVLLRETGYRRLALVTGKTSPQERTRVLDELRSGPGKAATVDLVVATSAFGLGIDYPHVRTVVHACLPETVDRWYQEVGRGGRDGAASAAFLITAPGDRPAAENLTIKVLTEDKARKRWLDLWNHARRIGDRTFVDLEGSRGEVASGSYNRRWNAQLVQGLVELDAVHRSTVDAEDIDDLYTEVGARHDWSCVEVQHGNLGGTSFWSERWKPWQQREWSRSRHALDAMTDLVQGRSRACEAIAAAYRPDEEVRRLFALAARGMEPVAPCGKCPGCRVDSMTPMDDPAPAPIQRWSVHINPSARLTRLADAAGAKNRLVLLTTDDHRTVAQRLAQVLIQQGVRHLAGPLGAMPDYSDWLFVDPLPVGPSGLTPCSSFIIYPPGHRVTRLWLSTRARLAPRTHESPAFDVLLVPRNAAIGQYRIGRDLLALDAVTALQILGG